MAGHSWPLVVRMPLRVSHVGDRLRGHHRMAQRMVDGLSAMMHLSQSCLAGCVQMVGSHQSYGWRAVPHAGTEGPLYMQGALRKAGSVTTADCAPCQQLSDSSARQVGLVLL